MKISETPPLQKYNKAIVIKNEKKSDELSVDLRSGSELKSSYASSENIKFKESVTKPPITI